MQEAACVGKTELLQALAAQEQEIRLLRERNRILQGQLDLLELRQEKQHRQIRSYEIEIEQLYQEKQVLEQMLQELPELYRRKLQARLRPIRERIAAIQVENRQLRRELHRLSYCVQQRGHWGLLGWGVQLPQLPRRDPQTSSLPTPMALPAQGVESAAET